MDKPSSTSAASTAFCAHAIEGPNGHSLWIDGNGKITAGNGTLDDPKPNAFSLVQIVDCPGSTAVCRASCYVHGLEKHAQSTHSLYKRNSLVIRRILEDGSAREWAEHMGTWIQANCHGGFRWHVSGDVFSLTYAAFIARVCSWSPNVGHWIYTRSFDFLGPLVDVGTVWGGNLAINLSCDSENYETAKDIAANTGLRLCYLSHDGSVPRSLPGGSVIFPDYSLRGGTPEGQGWFHALQSREKKMVCPVDFHGKSETRRCGPCDRCIW